jgi:hypothetical protein
VLVSLVCIHLQITKYIHFSVLRTYSKYVPLKGESIWKVLWNFRVIKPKDVDYGPDNVGAFDGSIVNKFDMSSQGTEGTGGSDPLKSAELVQ